MLIVLCVLALVIVGSEYVLVSAGRSCTGAQWRVDPKKDPYITEGSYTPDDSLILNNIPACSFDGRWRTEDLEGQALTRCWLAISAQVIAYLLFATDLLLYLMQVMLYQRNVHTLDLAFMEHRARQKYVSEHDLEQLNSVALELLPGHCKLDLLQKLQNAAKVPTEPHDQ